jgi:hypothetical protein
MVRPWEKAEVVTPKTQPESKSGEQLYQAQVKKDEAQQSYATLGAKIGNLVDSKQKAYGDSFGQSEQFLRLLWPDGIPVSSYGDVLTIARIWDKLKRIATDQDAYGESPYGDIVGYGLLGLSRDKKG